MSKNWKRRERQTAIFFGSTRTPLSGGSSKHTRSDTLHEIFFIEHKHRKSHATYNLYIQTRSLAKKENKLPLVTLSQSGMKGFLVVVHSSDLHTLAELLRAANAAFARATESESKGKQCPKPSHKASRRVKAHK